LYNESKSKTVGIRRAAAMASIAAARHSGEEDGRVCTDKIRYSYAESLQNGGAKCRDMTRKRYSRFTRLCKRVDDCFQELALVFNRDLPFREPPFNIRFRQRKRFEFMVGYCSSEKGRIYR
jgi:hypothetical protein